MKELGDEKNNFFAHSVLFVIKRVRACRKPNSGNQPCSFFFRGRYTSDCGGAGTTNH
jgi:hypothetical protein